MKDGDVEHQLVDEKAPLLEKPPATDYRADVDGLRAFAVISVVLYHMNPQWMPGGFAGVDIFFVISGFVVTSSLYGRTSLDHSAGDFIFGFFVRRAKRLLPVLVLVCLVSGTALAWAAPLWEQEMVPKFLKVGMAGLFGNANNWMLFGEVHDYWTVDDAAFNDYHPFLHLWSLGVEEQFYVFYPFVVLVALGSAVANGVSWGPSTQKFYAIMSFLLVASITVAWVYEKEKMDLNAFYFLPARFFELAAGAMLLPMCPRIKGVLSNNMMATRILELVGAGLLVAAVLCTDHAAAGFPVPWASLPVVAAMCYIAVGTVTENTLFNAALASKWPVYVGRLSYSIYLWHLPVLAIVQWMTIDGRQSITNNAFSGMLTLVLSLLSFHLVEDPVRRLRGVSKIQVLAAAVLSITAGACWLYGLMQVRAMEGGESFLVRLIGLLAVVVVGLCFEHLPWERTQKLMLLAGMFFATVVAQESFIYYRAQQPTTVSFALPPGDALLPSGAISLSLQDFDGSRGCACHLPTKEVLSPLAKLPLVASNASTQACFSERPDDESAFHVQLPDAACLLPTSKAISSTCLKRVEEPAMYFIADLDSSPLLNSVEISSKLPVFAAAWQPGEQNETITALKAVVKAGDVVAFAPHFATMKTAEEYNRRISALQEVTVLANAKLLLFDDIPMLPRHPKICALKQDAAPCTVSSFFSKSKQQDMRKVLSSWDDKDGVYTLQLHDELCDANGVCNLFIPGTHKLAYADSNHLNRAGSSYLAPSICSFLQKNKLVQ